MKKLVTLMLVLMMTISLFAVGCAQPAAAPAADAPAAEAPAAEAAPADAAGEQITLTVPHWYWNHGSGFDTWITNASEAFMKEYPNVTIEPVDLAYEEYWAKLDTAIAAGTPYDIMAFGDNVGSYIANGHLLALNDYIDMDAVNANFDSIVTETIPGLAADGKTYMISNANCFYMPMYRPSVLKKAGWDTFPQTYEELLQCCEDLKNAGVTPFALMTNPGNYGEQCIDIQIWSIAQGNNIVVDGKPAFNTEAVRGAYACIKEMYDKGYIIKDTDKGTYRAMLGTGEVGILFDGPWVYGIMHDADPSVEGDVAIANTSFFPAHKFSAGFEGFAVSSQTAHPDIAAKYVEFLTSKEQMKQFMLIVGIVTDRTDVFDEATQQEVLDVYPWFQGFIDGAPYSVSNTPVGFPADRINELQKIAGAALETILYENTDIDAALAQAQADAEALLG